MTLVLVGAGWFWSGAPAEPTAAAPCLARATRAGHDCGAAETPGFCAIFAPGTPEEYMQRFRQRFSNEIAFSIDSRWTQTATNNNTGGNGTPITLTYSFVPDGTLSVPDGYVAPGVTSIENKLFATMNAKFGSQAAWQNLFRDIFADWSALTGVNLVEETNDDGAQWVVSPGVLGVRADVRIVCIDEDGVNGVLAFNYFPNYGDMALDAAENWANGANDYRFLRNVVMHELGHGLGLEHVLPRDGTKLMEAFLSLGYTGPQDDDIRGAGFSYGDVHESNGSAGAADSLGAFASGTTFAQMALHSQVDVDWYAVSASAGTSIVFQVLPVGAAYSVGPDPGTPQPIDTRAILPLKLEVFDQDGVTLLASDAASAPGEGVFNTPVAVPSGDTGLLARVSTNGAAPNIQRYQLTLLDAASSPRALSVSTTPNPGAACTASPADAAGRTSFTTPFALTYANGQQVTLTAPQNIGTDSFVRWTIDGVQQTAGQMNVTVTMSADRSAVAEYVPALSVNAGADRVIVAGESVQLLATPMSGTPPYSYSWSPSSGLSSTQISNPVASPNVSTTYTVAVTDSVGHVGIDTVTVQVSTPLAVNAGPDRAALANQPVSLFVEVSGGEPPYTFAWSPSLTPGNAITQAFTARVSQTTSFNVTATDAAGRTAGDTVVVQVIEPLRVDAGVDVTIVAGETATLSAAVSGGLPPYSYSWRAGSGATQSASAQFQVAPVRHTTYTVTVNDASGQRSDDSVLVQLGDPFSAIITATPAAIARGDSSRLVALASGGQHPYMYEWSPRDGLSDPKEAATDASPAGTTTYTVVVQDATGRTTEASIELMVDDTGELVSPSVVAAPGGFCGVGTFLAVPAALLGLMPGRPWARRPARRGARR